MMKTIAAAGFLGLAGLSATPASAQAVRFDPAIKSFNTAPLATEQVQWRGRGFRGGYRGAYRGGYRGGYYRRGPGAGALIGGLAAGAIIGGAIASQNQTVYGAPAYGGDAVSYCVQRFRSYDPASGTYLGYDGQRHACP